MNGAWVEALIIIVIVAGFALVFWKGGAANPVGTGQLQSRVKDVAQEVKTLAGDLGRITDRMGTLETSCASSAEIETLRDAMKGDRRRVEQVFATVQSIEADISDLKTQQGRRDAVIEALSESVRALSTDLKDHRAEISQKLDHLDAMSERIDANARAIDAIVAQLPALRDKQAAIAEQVAGIAANTQTTARQVERLYDVLVPKGMQ